MPTFNSNVKPASAGLTLGDENQPWGAHLTDAFSDSSQSNTPFPALSGFVRMASTDLIAWRDSLNTSDVTLSKTNSASGTTPADTLVYSGSGIEGPFISHNQNPASTGEVRLAADDTISYRNTANSANIIALRHNADDSITFGGSAVSTNGDLTVAGNGTISGSLTVAGPIVPNGLSIVPSPLSTSSNLNITGAFNSSADGQGGGVNIVGAAGQNSTGTGGGVSLSGGIGAPNGPSAGGSATVTGGAGRGTAGTGGSVFINGGAGSSGGPKGTIQSNTYVSKYNNITLANNGMRSEVAGVALTSQTAAITTTILYSVPATGAGQYALNWNAKITTAAGTSSTLGALTVVYTDPDGVSVTLTSAAIIAAGSVATTSAANTTGTVLIGIPQLLNCKESTDITYAFAYASNAANAMTYNLNLVLEAL